MEVIPAIDIRDGRCVRLAQGDYARETVFDDDPAAVALRWQSAGAPRLHVVDLDGARDARPGNEGVVRRIVESVSIPVQVGGGVRDIATIKRYLDLGVGRVILGTAAVKDQTTLLNGLTLFRARIVVGVDARDGVVVTEGWLESSNLTAGHLVGQLSELGVGRIVYTDVSRDGMLAGPNLPAIADLLAQIDGLPSPVTVIASGGVSTVGQLKQLAALGVEGAIVGRAIYTGALDLATALAALKA